MHAQGIVARILKPCLSDLHAKRAAALMRAVGAVLSGGRVNLSAIALHLRADSVLKHRLKSVDRLLGNVLLHRMRLTLYRQLAQHWLQDVNPWLVVVDWSDVTLDQRFQLLRASLVVEGRSATLYEEVHPQEKLGNPKVQRAFVTRLATFVPPGTRVIVINLRVRELFSQCTRIGEIKLFSDPDCSADPDCCGAGSFPITSIGRSFGQKFDGDNGTVSLLVCTTIHQKTASKRLLGSVLNRLS